MNALKLYNAIILLSVSILLLVSLIVLASLSIYQDSPTGEDTIDLAVAKNPIVDPNVIKGKALFKLHCASCHNKNLIDDMTGPALAGVSERWLDYPESDLYKWIRNAPALIEEGHPKAKSLWAKYKKTMTAFPNLSDEEIAAILTFCNQDHYVTTTLSL